MTKLALAVGNLSLALVYFLFVAITQIYLHNDSINFGIAIGIILLLLILSFWKVHSVIAYKSDSRHNSRLRIFANIVPEKKVGLDFIVINLLPVVGLDFDKVTLTMYISRVVLVGMLLIITYSRESEFNPYFALMGFGTYKSSDQDSIILMRKKDYGNNPEYQSEFKFDEIENTGIFVLKELR